MPAKTCAQRSASSSHSLKCGLMGVDDLVRLTRVRLRAKESGSRTFRRRPYPTTIFAAAFSSSSWERRHPCRRIVHGTFRRQGAGAPGKGSWVQGSTREMFFRGILLMNRRIEHGGLEDTEPEGLPELRVLPISALRHVYRRRPQ